MTLECVLAQLPPLVFINFVSKVIFRSAIDTRPGDSYENNKLKVLLGRVLVAAVLGQVLHLVLLGPERVVMVVVPRGRLVALIAAVFLMTFVFHRELLFARSRHSKTTHNSITRLELLFAFTDV